MIELGLSLRTMKKNIYQGPVLQTASSLSLLVIKMLTVLVRAISNSQVFLLKKCKKLLQMQKLLTFFSAKILAYMPYLMRKVS